MGHWSAAAETSSEGALGNADKASEAGSEAEAVAEVQGAAESSAHHAQ